GISDADTRLDGVGYRALHAPAPCVEVHLIDEAPAPVFPWLERPHDRVPGRAEMLGGVLVRGVVTAADVAAGHAQAEVDPLRADAQAVLAPLGAWGHFTDFVEVGAAVHPLLPSIEWARQGSDLGPADYESAALPLSYGPDELRAGACSRSVARMGP